MSNTPRNLTRAQLKELAVDPRAVRVLEQLVASANSTTPEAIATIKAEADAALLAATSAQTAAATALAAANAAQADATAALAAIAAFGDMASQNANAVAITGGNITAHLKNNQTKLLESTTTLSNGAAAAVGTLSNAPTAGNPTKWVAIDDNGTTRYIPAW